MRDFEGAVQGTMMSAGVAVLVGLQNAAAAEDARRAAGWAAYGDAKASGRERALWQALREAQAELAAKSARIAALEDVVADLNEEIGDLHEELADLRELA